VFVACLRILQAALVYVNTRTLQNVLAEPARATAPLGQLDAFALPFSDQRTLQL